MRSERLVLRPPTLADEDEWLTRMRASRAYHRPWVHMPLTPETFRAYVERGAAPHREQRIACRLEDGALTGFFNIGEIVRGNFQNAFLGYGGVADFAGQGYMTEGLELVLREAFTTLKLHRIEANIQPGNAPSIALVARWRFRQGGLLRAVPQDRWPVGGPRAPGPSAPSSGGPADRRAGAFLRVEPCVLAG